MTHSDASNGRIELVPELRERAAQANADRRLPEENIKALRAGRIVEGACRAAATAGSAWASATTST